ncbi:unnamed protein product [Rotaria sp. Silwood1]|nr:unnamed protein product [Rotaria sp. Silwood1]
MMDETDKQYNQLFLVKGQTIVSSLQGNESIELSNIVNENDNNSDSGISQNDSEIETLIPNQTHFVTIKTGPLTLFDDEEEKWYIIASQVFLPFMIAGCGMVAAGLVLERVKELSVFKEITEIYILVPALLGLKGNLEMTLASRLSTQANIGNMDKKAALRSMIFGNIVLTQLQAIIVGFLAAIVSLAMGWVPQGHFNIRHALVLCSSSVATASIASLALGGIMIIVIVSSHKCKVNPDNIATPIAASLGDLTTLAVLAGIGGFLFKIIDNYTWLPIMITIIFLILTPIWIVISYRNEYVKDVLIHGWSPVVAAMFISSAGGLILDFAVQTLRGVAVFQPVMNGVGGNLVAVQASRLSTALHQHGKPGEFKDAAHYYASKICPNPYKVFFSKKSNSSTTRVLLFMAVPGHLTFVFIISKLATDHTRLSIIFIFFYLIAALIQVAILLYIAQWMVAFVWRHERDPDNVCIPYLTAIGDLLVSSISCYKCFSINGSNPLCEDFFQGDMSGTTSLLQTPCLTNLRGRQGLFPATHCIKLVAYSGEAKSVQYTYRTCSRDEGDDNGITRTSHCGFIKLDWIHPHRRFRGCLSICDKDACNQAYYHSISIWNIIFCLNLLLLLLCV